ncbi:penicillin acylase family protein [Larkinella rosea]|uniref:Acylase n=1 Tax=Larkinella rosea TaxID=2025312 RepID=A0A3P1C1N7_9BACT|nr:penicillin acylase family protein [Larkinella rosea]RRB07026.1 acylase [Larkinella rosea]
MRSLFLLTFLFSALSAKPQTFRPDEIARWQKRAKTVTIARDTWDIPHISGKTDADVVFGLLYTQCEDDFARVEENYIDAIGRMAEVNGETALYHDLRARLFMDTTQAIAIYRKSPKWLKSLLDAFADGTNYYLYSHPHIKPRLLTRFQPWMPLMFSEGSIGGNISVISTERLKAFYTNTQWTSVVNDFDKYDREPTGSNGFAIAPSKSASKNALLLINPHTSFYFRSEVHVTSEKGLNAYGAVTWGQFFVYQGFNQNCGWMHTSGNADSMDEYVETVEKRNGAYYYKHGNEWRLVKTEKVSLPYKTDKGLQRKEFTIYRTHHGPVAGQLGDQWITISMMNDPLNALAQSYLRTKAKDYESYKQVMKLNGNATNNTVYADRNGTIAYWHGNFVPKRNSKFDWSQPVDGSDPEADWKGLHAIDEIVQVKNPVNGWLQNCNSTPFTVAGSNSPAKSQYPTYMAPDEENFRGVNAVRVLGRKTDFTLDTLIAAANDPHLPGFEGLIPSLVQAYQTQAEKPEGQLKTLAEAIDTLRNWNTCYGATSVATSLAVFWGEKILRMARQRVPNGQRFDFLTFTDFMIKNTTPEEKVKLLTEVVDELTRDFGTWKTAWGEINRFQRLTGKISETFDDSKPSFAVGFMPSTWGSLAAFGARTYPGTKKRYGSVGNSFVAVVEFGERVKAKTVVNGGHSSNPASPHFNDQGALFSAGKFKDIWFYPEDIRQHVGKTYHPGE